MIRLIASLDSMTYSLQSGTGKNGIQISSQQAGICIYGRGTAQQSWLDMSSLSPHLWHSVSEELERQFMRSIQEIPLPDLESLTRPFFMVLP